MSIVEYFETLVPPPGVDTATYLVEVDRHLNDVDFDPSPAEQLVIGSRGGWDLRAAVWRPEDADGPLPVVLHLHGGGWVAGNHLSHRVFDALLARRGFLVVTIDYRRAPKHRFPAGLEDCVEALSWCREHVSRLGGDAGRIALVGDSAGANLAAAILASGQGEGCRAAALLFGIYDFHRALPVLEAILGGVEAETQAYLPAGEFEALRGDPRLSPEGADVPWPPIYVATGTKDPLAGESRHFHRRLLEMGVDHSYHELRGAPHSYVQLTRHPDFRVGMDSLVAFLRRELS